MQIHCFKFYEWKACRKAI
uniref:Uncharacterized protein n=1 Tax=Rhizophora mucronata TaxID=61149 RepID=A0A2P2IZY0_RHIMU